MDWLLVVVMVWLNPPPVLEIPVATKELCEQAAAQVRKDLSREAALATEDPAFKRDPAGVPGVVTTCLRVAN
jgi:hypothetical protein